MAELDEAVSENNRLNDLIRQYEELESQSSADKTVEANSIEQLMENLKTVIYFVTMFNFCYTLSVNK